MWVCEGEIKRERGCEVNALSSSSSHGKHYFSPPGLRIKKFLGLLCTVRVHLPGRSLCGKLYWVG